MMTDKPIISRCANCGSAIQLCSGSGCKEASVEIERLREAITAARDSGGYRFGEGISEWFDHFFPPEDTSDSFTREDSNHE